MVRPWKPSAKEMNSEAGLEKGSFSSLPARAFSHFTRFNGGGENESVRWFESVRRRTQGGRTWNLRANLMAASLASVPLLQKNTRSAKLLSTRLRARRAAGAVRNRLLVWHSRPAWSRRARCHPSSLWPSAFTAMPAVKSRYALSAAVKAQGASGAPCGVGTQPHAGPANPTRTVGVIQHAALAPDKDHRRAGVGVDDVLLVVALRQKCQEAGVRGNARAYHWPRRTRTSSASASFDGDVERKGDRTALQLRLARRLTGRGRDVGGCCGL